MSSILSPEIIACTILGLLAIVFHFLLIPEDLSKRNVVGVASLFAGCGALLIISDLWGPLSSAWNITVRSTFSTSNGAIVRDVAVFAFVLFRLRRRGGLGAVREYLTKGTPRDTLVAMLIAFAVTLTYHLVITIPRNTVLDTRSHVPPVPQWWPERSALRNARRSPIVSLIFKDTPLLTQKRREFINNEIDSFYLYLSKVGLDLPRKFPPIGALPGPKGSVNWAQVLPGTIYDGQVTIGDEGLDDPVTIRDMYSEWMFSNVVIGGNVTQPSFLRMAHIYGWYFASSYGNKMVPQKNLGEWEKALWEIRKSQGRDYTDQALILTLKSWHVPGQKEDFNNLFAGNLIHGFSVRDNFFEHVGKATVVLKQHGLMQQ